MFLLRVCRGSWLDVDTLCECLRRAPAFIQLRDRVEQAMQEWDAKWRFQEFAYSIELAVKTYTTAMEAAA